MTGLKSLFFWPAAILTLVMGVSGCGDEAPFEGPLLPQAEWVKVSTFACPETAITSDECTLPVSGTVVTPGEVHVQELVFTNAEYLFGILSWPLGGASSCDEQNSEGRCVIIAIFGPFDFDFGLQRIAFRLADPIEYRLDYYLMIGGNVLADTSFAFQGEGEMTGANRTPDIFSM